MRLLQRAIFVVFLASALAASFMLGHDDVALADTDNCASQGEYQQLQELMTSIQVRQLFDIPGTSEGNSPSGEYFRISYNACNGWTSKRVWCWFSYSGLGLQRWELR